MFEKIFGKEEYLCPFCFGTMLLGETSPSKCPRCSHDLPYGMEGIGNAVIAIVGPKAVGKSQYITVLVDYLMNEFSNEFDIAMTALTEETMKKHGANRGRHARMEVVEETQSNTVVANEPFVYKLERGRKKIALVFYDTAGEDFEDPNVMVDTRISKYLGMAAGIIYLIDPLQMSHVRDIIQDHEGVFERKTLPSIPGNKPNLAKDVLDRIILEIRKVQGNPKKKINTKLAVVLSKCDVICRNSEDKYSKTESDIIFGLNSIVYKGRERGEYDKDNIMLINKAVQDYLKRNQEVQLVKTVEQTFSEHCFFITSALGQNPEGGKLSHNVVPFRIEDSIIWLLKNTGSGLV